MAPHRLNYMYLPVAGFGTRRYFAYGRSRVIRADLYDRLFTTMAVSPSNSAHLSLGYSQMPALCLKKRSLTDLTSICLLRATPRYASAGSITQTFASSSTSTLASPVGNWSSTLTFFSFAGPAC